jgi:hypothetical protein
MCQLSIDSLYLFKGQVTFTYRIRGTNTIFAQKKEDNCTKKNSAAIDCRQVLFFLSFKKKRNYLQGFQFNFGATFLRGKKTAGDWVI